jgi:hypothetical protein
MKIAGKPLTEYFWVSRNFLAVIFIIMISIVVLRLSPNVPPEIQTLLSLSGGIVFVWAGWSSVRRHGFDLRQVSIVGLLLSLGVHWSLPIFHGAREVLYLIFINSSIYSIIAVFGGWIAKISALRTPGGKK